MSDPNSDLDPQTDMSLTGPGAVQTFLYYFSLMTLIAALVGSLALHLHPASPHLFMPAVATGAMAGTLGTLFNRTTHFSVAYQNRRRFQTQLERALTELGFELDQAAMAAQTDRPPDSYIYRRPGFSGWLTGRIFVLLQPQRAMVAGRAAIIQKMGRKLL
ncbi:hypothetical protein GS597_05995 [Synechococcales cyanobacterium C]|uniref:Uncharacterized protein n=1 Tax=Petrachloros mirabilis ULC683 TaxID=2781853 RepID=A0A8K1ZXT4_9CYAN|nr:hypothetical protein [Petrachloros mirabilis]NCJ06073.1 hypothetical protein [Petrachloros mirabilis ULC683]